MNYIINEHQAEIIAADYSYLIGKPFAKNNDFLIEEVTIRKNIAGNWWPCVGVYMGNKGGYWETFKHADLVRNLFNYLQEFEIEFSDCRVNSTK